MSKQDFGCGYSTMELIGTKMTGKLLSFWKETYGKEEKNISVDKTCKNQSLGFRPAAMGSELCHLEGLELTMEGHRAEPCRGQGQGCQMN